MQKLKKAITSFLIKNDLETGVQQNNAILIWEQIVGKKIAKKTEPEKVEFGVLTVKTEGPAWRQELVFKKQEIIDKLNAELGKNTIKEIRFV
mgnify:FL=1